MIYNPITKRSTQTFWQLAGLSDGSGRLNFKDLIYCWFHCRFVIILNYSSDMKLLRLSIYLSNRSYYQNSYSGKVTIILKYDNRFRILALLSRGVCSDRVGFIPVKCPLKPTLKSGNITLFWYYSTLECNPIKSVSLAGQDPEKSRVVEYTAYVHVRIPIIKRWSTRQNVSKFVIVFLLGLLCFNSPMRSK